MAAAFVIKQFLPNVSATIASRTPLLNALGRQNAVSLRKRHGLAFHQTAIFARQIALRQLKKATKKVDEQFTVISQLFAKQCNALCALRIRRTAQIIMLYRQLGYNTNWLAQVLKRLENMLMQNSKNRPLCLLFGAALFSWKREEITETDMKNVADEIYQMNRDSDGKMTTHLSSDWEVVFDKKHLSAWRKPVPNSYLYEYKMYGTFTDIPGRAFFNAQTDVEYRRQWDKLIIKLDIIDRDDKTGCEVVHWIMHFPYPMYSREYVFTRRRLVDTKKKLLVLMSRSTDHPQCPRQDDQYVRVDTYMSRMVIQPHQNFDDNGFDFVLTYYDDPKANFPRLAYNWMASTGVPDFVEKMHQAAKTMHEWQQLGKWAAKDDDDDDNNSDTTKKEDKMPM